MSEIARLRRQIELECEAARLGLEGLAIVASHDSINVRMERIWDYRQSTESRGAGSHEDHV